MLPLLSSHIPALTTIVSLFTLVFAVAHHKATCLCDLRSAIGDKSWLIAKDANLSQIKRMCNKYSAGKASRRGAGVRSRRALWMMTLQAKGQEKFS